MKILAKSDKGRVREQNEDYYYVSDDSRDFRLYMLADRYGTDMLAVKLQAD